MIEVVDVLGISDDPLATQSICKGGEASELTVSYSGGTGNVVYQWYETDQDSSSGGTAIVGATSSFYAPGVFETSGTYYYYVEVSASGSGCGSATSAVSQVVVVEDPTIDLAALPFQSLCQNASATSLEISVKDGLGVASYQWYENDQDSSSGGTAILGATSASYTPPTDEVGTHYYYCEVSQDVSGCFVASSVSIVEVVLSPSFSTHPVSETVCLGGSFAALEVSYENGTGVASYQWYENDQDSSFGGTAIVGATSSSYTPSSGVVGSKYYYVGIAFDSGGCSEIFSNPALMRVNDTPIVNDGAVTVYSESSFNYLPDVANGDSVPPGTKYTWSSPVVNPSLSISGAFEQLTPVALISQTLVNETNNVATVAYTVTPQTTSCEGNSFQLVVTVNPSIKVVETISPNTCYQSDDASIQVSISGGIPFSTGDPYQIDWSGPLAYSSSGLTTISGLSAGAYVLEIEDAMGHFYTRTYTVSEPEVLAFESTSLDSISCFGANDGSISVNVNGGAVPYQFAWTKDGVFYSGTKDVENIGPGSYELSVTDANNCGPITRSFELLEPSPLALTLMDKTDVLCFGAFTGNIDVSASGGRGDYQYSWTGPDGFTSNLPNLADLKAGDYTLTLTDDSGCSLTQTYTIVENNEIDIDYTSTSISCYGADDASITITDITGGLAPHNIEWSNFGTGTFQDNLAPGTYTITITDALNCSKDFLITIVQAPDFYIEPVVEQISCSGANDGSIALNLVGGLDPVTVNWNDDPSAGVDRNNLSPGTYTVSITNGNPCVINRSFTIFDIPSLQMSASVTDALLCDDANSGSIDLNIQGGTPPYDFSWSNGAVSQNLTNLPPATYYLTVRDQNGCEISDSWTVNRFDPLELSVNTETVFDCVTKQVDQTFEAVGNHGVPPYVFSWSRGTVSGVNNNRMMTDQNGLISLNITDSLGCQETYSFNVDIPEIGVAGFEMSATGYSTYGYYSVLDPIQFENKATGDFISISWNFGDGVFSNEENPRHAYTAEGTYEIVQTVAYPFGCEESHRISIEVTKGYTLMMPNAFTPNADGINDFYVPKSIGFSSIQLDVYDSWGGLIYTESGGSSVLGWDGKVQGEPTENGSYYYKFYGKTFYGKEITKEGVFTYLK